MNNFAIFIEPFLMTDVLTNLLDEIKRASNPNWEFFVNHYNRFFLPGRKALVPAKADHTLLKTKLTDYVDWDCKVS